MKMRLLHFRTDFMSFGWTNILFIHSTVSCNYFSIWCVIFWTDANQFEIREKTDFIAILLQLLSIHKHLFASKIIHFDCDGICLINTSHTKRKSSSSTITTASSQCLEYHENCCLHFEVFITNRFDAYSRFSFLLINANQQFFFFFSLFK